MLHDTRLLVVDDEDLICQACRRVLAPHGFDMHTTTDAVEGLQWAVENDYSAVLLDVKMAVLDGIQFLKQLRKVKADLPVILITGYPNMGDAASAVRLDAADYVTKPFSPEDIVRAVQKALKPGGTKRAKCSPDTATTFDSWVPTTRNYRFWGPSWLQSCADGTVRVGAVLTRDQSEKLAGVRLPGIGDTIYQGLPLAGLTPGAESTNRHDTFPAPVSGVVLAVNESLIRQPSLLATEPLEGGWIACLCPTRFAEELECCHFRHVVVVNAEPKSAEEQAATLVSLGCRVSLASGWDHLEPALAEPEGTVVLLDATSLGEKGPGLVHRINVAAPSMKIVVLASSDSRWESAYRRRRILYYALDPFSDNEIIDILDAAFQVPVPPARTVERLGASPKSVGTVSITNGAGTKVRLLATNGLLRDDQGLGREIIRKLKDRMYTVEIAPGPPAITPIAMLNAAQSCDRLFVLMVKNSGRLPGSLIRDDFGRIATAICENPGNVITLLVQPSARDARLIDFDAPTTLALAEHIVQEMVISYEAARTGPRPVQTVTCKSNQSDDGHADGQSSSADCLVDHRSDNAPGSGTAGP